MGITYVSGTAVGPAGEERVRFLVDSGAQYTLLPAEVWQKIGLAPRRRQQFQLADGTVMERDIGETPTPIVMGRPGDVALLGAVTLEELRLVLNPFTRTLHPATMLMV